jgi:hypothetical protein
MGKSIQKQDAVIDKGENLQVDAGQVAWATGARVFAFVH